MPHVAATRDYGMSASVALATVPGSGAEFEDYVAALLLAAGYYVERNVRRRGACDVLEIDSVGTRFAGRRPRRVLAEAKGGRWGFPDVFKLAGWMHFLGIERGSLFVKGRLSGVPAAVRDLAELRRIAGKLSIALVDLGDCTAPASAMRSSGLGRVQDPWVASTARWAFWVERSLIDQLRRARRRDPDWAALAMPLAYHEVINDQVFFLHSAEDRLRRLSLEYHAHPKLSAVLATELEVRCVARGAAPSWSVVRPLLAEALRGGHDPLLHVPQAALHIEHRARLAILKESVEYLLDGAASTARDVRAAPTRRRPLPALARGMDRLAKRPGLEQLAVLFQAFVLVLGGFYLADREREEFGWLAKLTGIAPGDIGESLGAFDDLFPLGVGSWLVSVPHTTIRLLKLVPAPLRGVGALFRLRKAQVRDFAHLGGGPATRRHLIAWHNAFIRLLAEERCPDSLPSPTGGAPNRWPASVAADAPGVRETV